MQNCRMAMSRGLRVTGMAGFGWLAALVAQPAARADWAVVGSLPAGRAYPGSAIAGGRWIVAGGQEAALATTPPVVAYDPVADQWDTATNLAVTGSLLQAASDPATGTALFVSERTTIEDAAAAFLAAGTAWSSSRL